MDDERDTPPMSDLSVDGDEGKGGHTRRGIFLEVVAIVSMIAIVVAVIVFVRVGDLQNGASPESADEDHTETAADESEQERRDDGDDVEPSIDEAVQSIREVHEFYTAASVDEVREHLEFIYQNSRPEQLERIQALTDEQVMSGVEVFLDRSRNLVEDDFVLGDVDWQPVTDRMAVIVIDRDMSPTELSFPVANIEGRWYAF